MDNKTGIPDPPGNVPPQTRQPVNDTQRRNNSARDAAADARQGTPNSAADGAAGDGPTGAFGASADDAAKADAASARRGRPSQATVLLGTLQGIDLYKATGSDDSYADVVENNIRRTFDVHQNAFREFLTLKSMEANRGKAMSRAAIDTVIDTCAAQAAMNPPRDVSLRFAAAGPDAWIDMGDDTWRAIHATPQGWNIIASVDVPVRFRRADGMLPLPMPTRVADAAASLLKLKTVVHLDDDDMLMLGTTLCMAMAARGPIAMPVLTGPPGAAKTSAMRFARRLIDPANTLHTRKLDKIEDFMVVALNNAILCVDNVSNITDDISDALCGVSTGQGEESRAFYQKKQLSSFYVRRLVMMTGVGSFVTRGDLMDRTTLLEVASIPESARKKETETEAAFNAIHPEVLGALLDGVSRGLAGVPRPAALPRMADFYHWCMGAAEAFAPPGRYEVVYRRKKAEADRQFISDDLVADAVVMLFDISGPAGVSTNRSLQVSSTQLVTIKGTVTFDVTGKLVLWEGTGQELLDTLRQVRFGFNQAPPKGWPQVPRWLSTRLDHTAGPLASLYGIRVKKYPTPKGHTGISLSR